MKINKIISCCALAMCLTGCYDGYIKDYDKIACGFANQTDVRSVVVGEGMTFSTGVALGGTIDNPEDRTVSFSIDHSLVCDQTYDALKNHQFPYIMELMAGVSSIDALPVDCYTLRTDSGKPGRTVIRKGKHLGQIDVVLDSAAFFAQDHLLPYAVIPLRIVKADGCDIMHGRETSVIGVRYEAMLFGNWYHGGRIEVEKDGTVVDEIKYFTEIPQADNRVWTLTTVAPFSVLANGVGAEYSGQKAQMKLTLGEDDSITISAVDGALFNVQPDGQSMYMRTKLLQNRKVVLNYKYENDGCIYHVHDTLTFRNRIRDGVNEWQDENQNNYE